ncbi:MAG: aldo/keto reductase [Planctomycetota bacterium]|jgi:aryl-alcohol dehydrogenase-like predicted oxidoreductase
MDRSKLGKTGLDVSKLSMGGLFVAGGTDELDAAVATMKRGYELGINYVDTAPGYGKSETSLGKIFAQSGRPEILSTKVGADDDVFGAQDPDALKASIENSLKLLGTDHFEMVMIHEPDRPGLTDWWTDMVTVEGPVLDVLTDYRDQGIIGSIGLGGTGVTELGHLVKSGKFDVVLTAFNYSILYREAADVIIDEAHKLGMGIISGSPLQQGGLATQYDAVYDESVYWLHPKRRQQLKDLYALCDDLAMTVADMAIRFVASNPRVDTILMGARNVTELEQNVASIEAGPLPADILAKLDEIAAVLPCRPYEEPSGMGFRLSCPDQYKGPGSLNY